MSKAIENALIEAVKEALRFVLVGLSGSIIPIAMAGVDTVNGAIMINWLIVSALLLATVLGAVARGIDKFLHEWGKETDNENLTKGLTRF